MKPIYKLKLLAPGIAVIILYSSCKKFIEIDPPQTELAAVSVYSNDVTAKAALLGIYYQMTSPTFGSGGISSVTFLSALSSDETVNYDNSSPAVNQEYLQFNDNSLISNNTMLLELWSQSYQCIYGANALIEGLASHTGVPDDLKNQITGEAKFIRAFYHFYLLNLFGEVPLAITSDYRTNSEIQRASGAQVYQQIIADLKAAQSLLADDYSFSGNERNRINKWAATALLARAYLFNNDWANAETQAGLVINNTALYKLVSLDSVFLKNNPEAIWQISRDNGNSLDAVSFLAYSNDLPSHAALQTSLVDAFEVTDQRKEKWIGSNTFSSYTYYYPNKYKTAATSPITEYSMVLRLGEQFLIRAEARARQGNITGPNSAEADVNIIRNRAGLENSAAFDQTTMLALIEEERRFELFTEWGHRWFDLKRTGRLDAVLSPLKLQWVSTAALYPIPEYQILNSHLTQNPGY